MECDGRPLRPSQQGCRTESGLRPRVIESLSSQIVIQRFGTRHKHESRSEKSECMKTELALRMALRVDLGEVVSAGPDQCQSITEWPVCLGPEIPGVIGSQGSGCRVSSTDAKSTVFGVQW